MESGIKTKKLRIGGMTCVSCQNKIEKKLRNTAGVKKAAVSYSAGTADITYDADVVSLKAITAVIEKLDYKVLTGNERQEPNTSRILGILIIIVALYVLMQQFGVLQLFGSFQLAEAGMGYGMLFLIGLITSVHCVAMCGGINLSQCIPQAERTEGKSRFTALRPSLLYNLGRVISYTAVGGIVGALGSAITFSGGMRGIMQLIAGVFMVIMGINMLGIFPWLRKLNPRMPKIFARKIDSKKSSSKSPLIVGLLNGLMPCGPLQAMQIYALSTGSPFAGALSMLLFSLGTVPLMFGIGALSSVLTKKFTHKVMTVGAVLVVVLGLSMFSQGWSLSGFSLSALTPKGSDSAPAGDNQAKTEDGVQIVNSTLSSGKYPAITVQAGTPVKWIINAPQGSINGCNNRIFIQEYNIEYQFKTGENVIEFTPTETGRFSYSCWMGMIRGSITVVEAGTETPAADAAASAEDAAVDNPAPATPVPAGYTIPADNVAVAEITDDDLQQVKIQMTDSGFSPAVIVVQAGLETEWIIDNNSSREGNSTLLFPFYSIQIPMISGENPLSLYPTDSFDFSTSDNAFYGYVKVVDDLNRIDTEAIREEAGKYQTLIWPSETFAAAGTAGGGGGAACH